MVGEGQFGLRYKGMECQPPEEDRMWQTGEYGTLRRLEWPQLTSWGWHPVWGLTFWINKLLCTRVTLWVLIELTSEGPALNWSYSHKTKQNKMAVILFYFSKKKDFLENKNKMNKTNSNMYSTTLLLSAHRNSSPLPLSALPWISPPSIESLPLSLPLPYSPNPSFKGQEKGEVSGRDFPSPLFTAGSKLVKPAGLWE